MKQTAQNIQHLVSTIEAILAVTSFVKEAECITENFFMILQQSSNHCDGYDCNLRVITAP